MLNFSNSIVLSVYVRMYVVCVHMYTEIYLQPNVQSKCEDCTLRTQICRISLHNPAKCTVIEGLKLLHRDYFGTEVL
jgi:hypothetical protein